MFSYSFQSMLYRTRDEMLAAIAGQWLCGNGLNDERTQRDILAQQSDDELARECIEAWGLDQPTTPRFGWNDPDAEPSDMERYGYSIDDLRRAFADLREDAA